MRASRSLISGLNCFSTNARVAQILFCSSLIFRCAHQALHPSPSTRQKIFCRYYVSQVQTFHERVKCVKIHTHPQKLKLPLDPCPPQPLAHWDTDCAL